MHCTIYLLGFVIIYESYLYTAFEILFHSFIDMDEHSS